jgi:DNA-directed RNA polymerase subunit RPC12/RpoP
MDEDDRNAAPSDNRAFCSTCGECGECDWLRIGESVKGKTAWRCEYCGHTLAGGPQSTAASVAGDGKLDGVMCVCRHKRAAAAHMAGPRALW